MSAEAAFDALDEVMSGPDPDWESEPLPAVDLEEADRWLTRLAKLDRIDEQTRMLAGMRRQTVDEWEAEELARTKARREWLERSLRGFHAALLETDPKLKTVNLPAGSLKARAQQPDWSFNEDRFLSWALEHHPELIRIPAPRPQVDRAEAKKALTAVDGRAVDPETGEVADGVTVVERGPKFTQEPNR